MRPNCCRRPHFLRCLFVVSVCFIVTAEIISCLVYVQNIPAKGILHRNMKYSVGLLRKMSIGETKTIKPHAGCSSKKLGRPHSFSLIGLSGYPKSGLTWSKLLLEYSTGFYGSNIFNQGVKKKKKSKRSFSDSVDFTEGRTICAKSNRYEPEHIKKFEAAILLMRSPIEAILSEAIRNNQVNRNLSSNEFREYFQSSKWRSYVLREGLRWRNLNIQWLLLSKSVLVMHFDLLANDTSQNLRTMIRFLNVPVNEERISCAISRSGVVKEDDEVFSTILDQEPYTPELYSLLLEYVIDVNVTLLSKGHRPFHTFPVEDYQFREIHAVTPSVTPSVAAPYQGEADND